MPSIFAGVKTSLTLALVGAIVGEFVGARARLGFLLASYSYRLQVDRVWAVTIVLALLGIILFLAIEWVDKKVVSGALGAHPSAKPRDVVGLRLSTRCRKRQTGTRGGSMLRSGRVFRSGRSTHEP